MFFFFSSRRRHTSWPRDWSSDVCSSDLVREGRADRAMVPIENSVEGGVSATMDALSSGVPLVVVGEAVVRVEFVLVARRGTTLEQVRHISTHPHAWAQCRRWLTRSEERRGGL